MKFTYTYRSSDGQRHTAEIEAESRDAAFTRVRTELGIKPIKMMVAEEANRSPSGHDKRDRFRRILWGTVILAGTILAAAFGAWWFMGRAARPETEPYQVMTPQGAVTLSTATPLPRQTIPGDRRRIADAAATFKHPAETWLARYAEPGRQPPVSLETPPAADFGIALREPIRIASTDFTEVVDLKRIVTGMKREMNAYIAGGGTIEQYLSELVKRQKLEVSYRENAEKRLEGMLSKPKEAYAYWLKANASLKSMGIYELPLPPALHGYQAGLDLDE